MFSKFEKYKGIHPGAVLERELARRNLAQRPFALSIHEHPQSLNAISKGKRGMNVTLALKIEKEFGWEEGTLMMLQVFYDIKLEQKRQKANHHPDLTKLRTALFWDTKFEHIDWERHYRYIINRVFERGIRTEKEEILKFYGKDKVEEVAGSVSSFITTTPSLHRTKKS